MDMRTISKQQKKINRPVNKSRLGWHQNIYSFKPECRGYSGSTKPSRENANLFPNNFSIYQNFKFSYESRLGNSSYVRGNSFYWYLSRWWTLMPVSCNNQFFTSFQSRRFFVGCILRATLLIFQFYVRNFTFFLARKAKSVEQIFGNFGEKFFWRYCW